MSGPKSKAAEALTEKAQLVDYIASGCKPRDKWRIGTEHEKFGYQRANLLPLPYEGEAGVKAMLEGLTRFGWQPVYEKGAVIALTMDGGSVSLEPGGQFELSGAPLINLHQTCTEVHTHLDQVKQVAEEIGAGFLGLGFTPDWRRDQIPVMPKGRYGIMRAYMPTKGDHGLDMMFRSSTVQVNLDFSSEADMVQKFRTSMALQPIATALFANSPFTEGKPNGYLSFRSFIWTDTDPDRTGMLDFVYDDNFGFERYVDYALDVPMYFVYRDGTYIDASGQSFRDFLKGQLPALPSTQPTLKDWEDHLTTLFPEVRLKRYLEMRGADGGPWSRLCALPAFWVGLLYDDVALEAASALCADWTAEERQQLRLSVPKTALQTKFRSGTVQDIAAQAVEIAEAGLKRRAKAGTFTADETEYLEPLKEIVASGQTNADILLLNYHSRWSESVTPIYEEFSY